MSMADELKKLQELHASGALSDEEYAQAKARILNAPPAPAASPEPAARATKPPAPPRRENKPPPPPPPSSASSAAVPILMVVVGLIVLAAIAGIFAFANLDLPFGQGGKGGVTLKVDSVDTSHETFRIHMTATNTTKDTLRLPLFGYFFVTDDFGNQYEADPFASTFPTDVAPGATVSGYALMKKPLDPRATRLKVAFTTVFGSFAVKSVSVDNVPVTPARLER
jgi:hypothetical protein